MNNDVHAFLALPLNSVARDILTKIGIAPGTRVWRTSEDATEWINTSETVGYEVYRFDLPGTWFDCVNMEKGSYRTIVEVVSPVFERV